MTPNEAQAANLAQNIVHNWKINNYTPHSSVDPRDTNRLVDHVAQALIAHGEAEYARGFSDCKLWAAVVVSEVEGDLTTRSNAMTAVWALRPKEDGRPAPLPISGKGTDGGKGLW